jgi:D-alanine-D-alanine ligase-like ATP-grasp enzyme
VRHFETFCNESIASAANQSLSFPGMRAIHDFVDKVSPGFARFFIGLFRLCGCAVFQKDIRRAKTLRSALIWREAERRGIVMEQLIAFGRPTEWYRARIDGAPGPRRSAAGRWRYFESVPLPPALPRSGHQWLDDKHLLKVRLRKQGIPTPRSVVVRSARAARAAFEAIGVPVVVKPCTGSRGRHTTVFVSDSALLEEAFARAQQLNHFVVIEEYLAGSVCRATIVAGVLRGFLKADPPTIIGDGKRTITELISEKNRTRSERVAEVLIRPELTEFVARQGYALLAVLPKGKQLPLLFRTGRLFGGKTREMLSHIHPEFRVVLEKAGSMADAPVVGFDVIIPDPTRAPEEQKWGIIEGNSLPFIDLHDFALEGAPANVASHIWDLWR